MPSKSARHAGASMNLTPAESPEVYNKVLRKEGRDLVGTFLEELVELAKATVSLRAKN